MAFANLSNISSSAYCKYNEPDTELKKVAKHTALLLAVALGISFNVFAVILAAKCTVRKSLYHLIINMAVSDALFLLTMVLLWLPHYGLNIYPSGIAGVIICKATYLMQLTSCRVSLVTLLVISIERLGATRCRIQSRPYTLKRRAVSIGACWLIPMTVAACYTQKATPSKGWCGVWRRSLQANLFTSLVWLFQSVVAIILCGVIFFLSILIIRRLTKTQRIHNHLSEEQQSRRAIRKQAAVRMVLASVLLYTCCWLPYSVLTVIYMVSIINPSAQVIKSSICSIDWNSFAFIAWNFLPVINSCLSPCIYFVFLSDFQAAIKKILCRRKTNETLNRIVPTELQTMSNPYLVSCRIRTNSL